MSGYPYGNSGNPSGYPPPPPSSQYGGNYNNYGPPPPSMPNYGDTQSCASLYGTPGPMSNDNNNYPSAPYDAFGGNQMPNAPYGNNFNNNNYAPPPPPLSQPQYGGYGNPPYQPGPPPPPFGSQSAMYPNNYPQQPPPLPPQQQHAGHYGMGGGIPPGPSGYPPDQSSALFASLEQYQGTIYPAPNFNPEADCHALNHAMRGAGTNERALIDIVSNRSNLQRQQIKYQYKTMFGADLEKQLGSELSGNFKEAMAALFDSPSSYDAWSLHEAINYGREGTLREIILTRSNAELRAIVETYRRTYNKDLEHGLNHRILSKDFKRILISMIQAHREELSPQQIQQARQMGIESVIDRNRAIQDADALYRAGAGKWGTDEKTFNAIFTQRSYIQLRATFEEYQKKHRQDMAQVIRSEFSGDAKDAYLALITCIRDRPTFFAERIHKAVSGLGTRDSALIRIIITRSEIDLMQIKQRYQQMYHRSLAQDVGGDTSGDYKRLLLAIIK